MVPEEKFTGDGSQSELAHVAASRWPHLAFRKDIEAVYHRKTQRSFRQDGALLWLGWAGIMLPLLVYYIFMLNQANSATTGGRTLKLVFVAMALFVSMVKIIVNLLCFRLCYFDRKLREFWETACFVLIGGCLAVSNHISDSSADVPHNQVGIMAELAFLAVTHSMGSKHYGFMALMYGSIVIACVHLASSLIWAVKLQYGMGWGHIVVDNIIFLVATFFLCKATLVIDQARRDLFALRQHAKRAENEYSQLNKEKKELRSEVYTMTLAKFEIVDVQEEEMNFDSPLEKAMAIVQTLQKDPELPKRVFDELKQVVVYLGNSTDIFKPSLQKELDGPSRIFGVETQRWLRNLLNQHESYVEGGTDSLTPHKIALENAPTGSPATAVAADGTLKKGDSAMTGMESVFLRDLEFDEQKKFKQLLGAIEDWNFDLFDVVQHTSGNPLLFIGMALFQKYDLIVKFKIDPNKLKNFLTRVEAGYQDRPYHNSTHAADVTRTVHYFLVHGNLLSWLNDEEILGLVFASLVHDFDHPGRNNKFQVDTSNPKALLYNDTSVLEMHHCAQAFLLVLREENKILENLTIEQYRGVRAMVVDMVLGTELSKHFDIVGQFKAAMRNGQILSMDPPAPKPSSKLVDSHRLTPIQTEQKYPWLNSQNRLLIMKMAVKCGDLGHAAKSLDLHVKWTLRITEEFYQQGDDERKHGLPVSPFMDRRNADLPSSQVGFMDFLVIPMFEQFLKFCDPNDDRLPALKELRQNREHWKSQVPPK